MRGSTLPDVDPGLVSFREAVVRALATVGDAPDAPDRRPPDARTLWRALGKAGVISALYERPSGDSRCGPGIPRLDVLLTELDSRYPTGLVLSVCVQVATVIPVLREATARGAAKRVGQGALGGDLIIALGVTDDAAAGSDLLNAGTRLRAAGDGAVLDGGKDWITNACFCDYALVLARHREVRHFTSFRWVLVPATAPGVSARPASETLFAGSGVGHLRFRDVALADDYLAGPPGRGLGGFVRHVGTERLAGALWARALCRRVLSATRQRLARRALGGRSLWENDALRKRFARCLVELRRIDALCRMHQTGLDGIDAASGMLLKASVAESVSLILGECVQMRGADAFRDGGEAILQAEAAMFGIAGGATGAMLAGIADHADELLEARTPMEERT